MGWVKFITYPFVILSQFFQALIFNYVWRINQLIQQAIGGNDIESKIEQILNRYWVKNGATLTPATGISNVNAQHFFKITD